MTKPADITATVSVTDNGDGTLSSKVTYDSDRVAFANKSKPGELRINKYTYSRLTDANKDDQFTIRVTFNNEKGLPLGEGDSIYWYVLDDNGNPVVPETAADEPADGPTADESSGPQTKRALKNNGLLGANGSDVDDIASGVASGGVNWRVTADGVLIIGKEGETQTFAESDYNSKFPWMDNSPWYHSDFAKSIRKVVFKGNVKANCSIAQMFVGLSNMESIDFTNFDTSSATSATWMFEKCRNLKEIVWGDFDTSNMSSISGMFQGCSSLKELDLSFFNTSKVTGRGMTNLFSGCTSLEIVNLSSFDTSKVTGMGGMFRDCSSLKALDLSSFKTYNVVSMWETADGGGGMFRGCSSLVSLDLSNFDVSKVGTTEDTSSTGASNGFADTFRGCTSLRNLNIANWNVSNAPSMSNMFDDCSSLTTLDIANWDVSKCTSFSNMFRNCSSERNCPCR